MLTCDWCDQEIRSKKQTGYSIEAAPFRPLNIGGLRKAEASPVIVAEMHFHEKCRESFFREVRILLNDHEPTDEELEFDHSAADEATTSDDDNEKAKREARFWARVDAWKALPKHEQDRMVLEALGDGKLTNREIEERLVEHEDRPHPSGHSQQISPVTRRLLAAKEVERQEGPFGASRFRYFRPKPSEELRRLGEQLEGNGS